MDHDNTEFVNHLKELEIRCITDNLKNYTVNFPVNSDNQVCKLYQTFQYICENIVNYDFAKVLKVKSCDFPFSSLSFDKINCEMNSFDSLLEGEFSGNQLHSYMKQLIILFICVSALQEFIRCNFSGPYHENIGEYDIISMMLPDGTFSDDDAVRLLSKDGEMISLNVRQPKLLYLCNILLSSVEIDRCLSYKWWLLRCTCIHQLILPERNVFLHDKMTSLIRDINELEWLNWEHNTTAKVMFFVESAQIYLHYHEIVLAKKCIEDAQTICGLEIALSGAIGKRTQYQQIPVAQLFVKINKSESKVKYLSVPHDNNCFPCDLQLQDDTLLNKVVFTENDQNLIEDLSLEEQVVLLGYCCLTRRSSAFDDLLQEELMSYINCLLAHPKVWSVHLKALTMRCSSEKKKSRRVERAMMQMEEIINSIKQDSPQFSVRQSMIFCTACMPYWILEKELADLLLSLGATKSALEIYERLKLWDSIVICYQNLGRTKNAEEIIHEQLKKKQTPMLWCLLGDVTNDPNNYIKAWELSECRSARAQRSLGYYYFKKKEYEKCLPFFMKSLDINHLQINVWFSVGYSATQLENYELAARAYRQVVMLDPDSFEAWNNLSNAYIKLKQKVRAWRSLQEALRCNYEEWRVWENFLLVSIDVGAFEDVLRAWHRLLDIKGKHQDSDILEILVNAIDKDLMDIHGLPSSRLKPRTLQLFGRLTSMITNNSKIWELYSLLYSSGINLSTDKVALETVVFYQQKAVHCCNQKGQWEKDVLSCKQVLSCTQRLAEVSILYLKLLEGNLKNQQKASSKLAVQNVICRAEKYSMNFQTSEKDELDSILCTLKKVLNEILSL